MLSEKQFIFEYIWVMTIKQLKDTKKLQIIESNVYFQSFLMDMFFSLSFCITCENTVNYKLKISMRIGRLKYYLY